MAVPVASMYCGSTVFQALLVVFVTLCFASSAHAKGAARPGFGPPASWVRENPLPDTKAPPVGESLPTATLLSDRQIRIGKDQETFVRRAYRVLSQTGVENGSQIEWEFDPLYERLVLHFIRIRRDGKIIDALRPSEIKVVQREPDLDMRVYRGSESALSFVHDVRVGDVIDYAYSIVGSNPILRGKASIRLRLAERAPTARLSIRLLLEEDRSVDIKTFGIEMVPTILKNESTTEYVWARDAVPAIVVDDQIPSWFDPFPSVEATEFRSWNEVAGWASELFERELQSSAAMHEAVAGFAKGPDPASRVLAAIRFVQDDVRYLGIELGENSHQPFPPATVFERRFGDCKDKSLLLVTFLRELGIDAHVALVDTDFEAAVADHAPSPFAFDHAIVSFRLDGRDVFVDPTQTSVRGSFSELVPPRFGRALVVSRSSTGLVELPTRPLDAPLVEEKQLYTVTSYDAPAHFEVETIYRQNEANGMRRHLADTPRSQLGREYLNYYAKLDPKITPDREPEAVDDVDHNVITVREAYQIPAFWDDRRRDFSARLIDEHMTVPRISLRTMPLGLQHPEFVAQTIEVVLPEDYDIETEKKEIVSSGFKFNFAAVNLEKRFRLHYEYRTLRDSVDSSDMEGYRAKLDEVKALTGYSISRGSTIRGQATPDERKFVAWVLGGLVTGVVGIFGIGAAVTRGPSYLRLRRFRRKQRLVSGEGPASAIPANDEAERRRHLDRFRCECGGRWGGSEEQNRVRYGDGYITVFRGSCTGCGREHRVYFCQGVH